MLINLKRVYEIPDEIDGFRVLSGRLWPRGIKKEVLHLDFWAKEVAPSTALRKRYHQDGKFEDFKADYTQELLANPAFASFLEMLKPHKVITLLTASKLIEKSALPILKEAISKNLLK